MENIKGMENTKNILAVIQKELNTNPIARAFMDEAAKRAEALNLTIEQWEQAKLSFMTSLFYKLALDHKDIQEQIAQDVYKLYNE